MLSYKMHTTKSNNFHNFTAMEELWKTIPGFEDYRVSNLGRVRSLKFGKQKILKQFLNQKQKENYWQVKLMDKSGKVTGHKVHVLVYLAFYNIKGDRKYKIHHINGNSTDNRIENLKLVTHRENCSIERSIRSGLPTGVWRKSGKYYSKIWYNGKNLQLGSFSTPEEASQAYQNKLKEITNHE